MVKRKQAFDVDLEDLDPPLRWREWVRRIMAVLFASDSPVSREQLSLVVGQGAVLDDLIADLREDLTDLPVELVSVGDGFLLRTRTGYGDVIRVAANLPEKVIGMPELKEFDFAVLAAIAYNQPVSRAELEEIFGRNVGRELIGRLFTHEVIAQGPRKPQPGAPHTFVTTDEFLAKFGLSSLDELPEPSLEG